ncbi:GTP pyrophosphokinase [Anaerostipes sp.]|uniref:GTP pyrophosphokinase n=1 Tax=Anaerostipes sp. TaxID=1872530 RepID=UPI0025B91AC8|nr:GTP pyrophosphokinase family protein [Anaerostipes sp.]MBS7009506.1 GTP pyrophosphokinase family protein [Anaerostipes sp.]
MAKIELPDVKDIFLEYRKMQLLYQSALKEIGTKLEILNDEFKFVHKYNPIEHIESRMKSEESIVRKLMKKGQDITVENIERYIDDVAGIRVICSFTPDIYRIVDMISNQDDIEVVKTKDYMVNPKPSGYRSYHMIVKVPIFLSDTVVPTRVEIQIRTVAMDFWASLEHKIYYKYDGHAPEYIRSELRECAEMISFLDSKMLAINEEIHSLKQDGMREEF